MLQSNARPRTTNETFSDSFFRCLCVFICVYKKKENLLAQKKYFCFSLDLKVGINQLTMKMRRKSRWGNVRLFISTQLQFHLLICKTPAWAETQLEFVKRKIRYEDDLRVFVGGKMMEKLANCFWMGWKFVQLYINRSRHGREEISKQAKRQQHLEKRSTIS